MKQVYKTGKELYGNDFSGEALVKWLQEEKEGYANLESSEAGKDKSKNLAKDSYEYMYHALNVEHGYKNLPKDRIWKDVISFGGAYGDELRPILSTLESVKIIEASQSLRKEYLGNIPLSYQFPRADGVLELPDESCDLMTCLGVLHHIPNVEFVFNELARVIKRQGYLLVREPIVSMGDWEMPRRGLTKNERGIPLEILRGIIRGTGLNVIRESLCVATPLDTLMKMMGGKPFNNRIFVKLDKFASKLLYFNYCYHAESMIKKIRPVSVYYVLRKD